MEWDVGGVRLLKRWRGEGLSDKPGGLFVGDGGGVCEVGLLCLCVCV